MMNADAASSFASGHIPTLAPNALEQAQTTKRLIISLIIIGYAIIMGTKFSSPFSVASWAETMVFYWAIQTIFTLGLFFLARWKPAPNPARRIVGMLADYGFLGLAIHSNPEIMMPLYTVIIWVTLGNGLRYGRTYLLVATVLALVTIFTVGIATYDDARGIYVTAMVISMVLAIPQYAVSLTSGVETARRDADAANIAKSRFLAQASHDLRQPIHAISLFLASLQRTGLRPAQQDIVDRIDRSLQGVARLFKSLLDLSTLDSGSVKVVPVAIPIGNMVAELVQQNTELARKHECSLRAVYSSQIVWADRSLLTTMVQNLLSNAFKFAPGKTVLIGCRRTGSTVSIQVLDQGAGITKAQLPKLFDEFYQVKGRGDKDQQGVGLGLTIVSRMAKLMSLVIEVTSAPGKGSNFSISGLTVAPASAQLPIRHDIGVEVSPISGLRILLVEDDLDVLAATSDLIDGWGCHTTAISAIPPQFSGHFDLIIFDFDLGNGTTGADCLDPMRWPNGAMPPGIVVTAHDENWVSREINDPNVVILKKPLQPAELRSAIGAARLPGSIRHAS